MNKQQLTRIFNVRFWFLLALFLIIAGLGAKTSLADTTPVNYENDQIVVRIMPDSSIETINNVYGTTTVRRLLNNANIYLLQAAPAADAASIVELMNDDPAIQYAELNLVTAAPEASGRDIYGWNAGGATTTNDQTDPRILFGWELGDSDSARYYDQPAVHDVKADQTGSGGSGVTVAVLDTGIDFSHPALAGHITGNGYDFVDDDNTPEDQFNNLDDDGDGFVDEAAGHGTHVAGIIHLVASEAQIMPLRVLDSDGQGNAFVVAEAMLYAAENGADVINLSLGTTRQSQFLLDVVAQVTANNVVVVAAAGNLAEDTPQYPAAADCALAVTAVGPGRVKTDYANYGNWIDVAAPGERIYSSYPGDVYAWWNGTSMAAPFVAGQAALLRSQSPSLSLAETGQLITGTAASLDNANPQYRGLLGAGLINVQASLDALASGNWPAAPANPLAGCGR